MTAPPFTDPPAEVAAFVARASTAIAALGALIAAPGSMRACVTAAFVMSASAEEIAAEMIPKETPPETASTVREETARTAMPLPPVCRAE